MKFLNNFPKISLISSKFLQNFLVIITRFLLENFRKIFIKLMFHKFSPKLSPIRFSNFSPGSNSIVLKFFNKILHIGVMRLYLRGKGARTPVGVPCIIENIIFLGVFFFFLMGSGIFLKALSVFDKGLAHSRPLSVRLCFFQRAVIFWKIRKSQRISIGPEKSGNFLKITNVKNIIKAMCFIRSPAMWSYTVLFRFLLHKTSLPPSYRKNFNLR